jgi:two-component system, NtrC family, response regulator
MTAHSWPGNVRELENRLKRAVVMAERRLIDASDLELAPSEDKLPDLDLRAARLRAEREVIQGALARSSNTLSVAARLLGVSRPTLYSLMQVHGIEIELGKGGEPAAAKAGAGTASEHGPLESEGNG